MAVARSAPSSLSLLYSVSSTPRSMSQMTVSAFDEKASELDKLKRLAVLHMKQVNALKMEYMEWWSNRQSSFLSALHTVKMLNRSMCPQTVTSMADFNKLMDMAYIYKRAGKLYLPNSGLDHLEMFGSLWTRYLELRDECDTSVLSPVNAYCFTLTRLRDPNIKTQIDDIAQDINIKCDPDYNFRELHNIKENLFAYRTGVCNHELIGFIGFLSHLCNLQRKICYLITKLYVEKE